MSSADSELKADLERWRAWIEGPIRSDVIGMHHRRFIWRGLHDAAGANPAVAERPSAFWDFLGQGYAATQAIAIRRQADTDRRVSSLALLIKQMRENADALTRESFVGQFDQDNNLMVQRGQSGFDELAGGGDHLDPSIPSADLDTLQAAARHVRRYVDEHIAHDAAQPTVPGNLTFGDLHDAIDAIGDVCRKYTVLLTAGWWVTWEPVMQEDWLGIFRVAWLPAL